MPDVSEYGYRLKSQFRSVKFRDQDLIIDEATVLKPANVGYFKVVSEVNRGQQVKIDYESDNNELQYFFEMVLLSECGLNFLE